MIQERRERRASSTDVARLANVSQSAVSRTFTPGASISAATRAKVLSAAEALNYRPNLLPRMLHGEQTNMVALVAGGLTNPYYATVLDGVAAALRKAGKLTVLVRVSSDQSLDEVVADLERYRVDAVVSALSVRSAASSKALEKSRIPVIQLAHGATGSHIWTVSVDNEDAGRRAAKHLLDRGCRRLGYIGATDSPSQDRRERGFVAELASRNMGCARGMADAFTHAGGFAAATEMLDHHAIDGLFGVNDLIACGALDAARRHDCPLPAIIGFDDIPQAAWPTYHLTTFSPEIDHLVTGVMTVIEGREAASRETLIHARLIERESTFR